MESPFQPAARTTPSRRPIRVTVLVVFALLIGPAIVLANHQFNDVPTGASYHDDVEAIVGAGITTGCSATNYCPGNAVTRGQMAQFLNRGLGIATSSWGTLTAAESEKSFVTTITIPAGAQSGGTGHVTVSADLVAAIPAGQGTCPCGVSFFVVGLDVKAISPIGSFLVPEDGLTGVTANTGTVSWVFEVPSGADASFGLIAQLFTQPPIVLSGEPEPQGGLTEPTFNGTLTAEYSPFGFEQPGPVELLEVSGGIVNGPYGPMTVEGRTR
jgi:hypothetical protein